MVCMIWSSLQMSSLYRLDPVVAVVNTVHATHQPTVRHHRAHRLQHIVQVIRVFTRVDYVVRTQHAAFIGKFPIIDMIYVRSGVVGGDTSHHPVVAALEVVSFTEIVCGECPLASA